MKRLSTLLILVLFAAQALASSPAPPPPPSPDPLLADGQIAMVKLESLDELHAVWEELSVMFGHEGGAEDFHAYLAEGMPGFADMTDFGLPVIMTVRIPPLMMQQEPLMTALLPLQPSITDVSGYVDMDDVKTVLVQEGYAALSGDPGYTPAAEVPALAVGMLDGIVSASIDFRSFFDENEAMIDMALASAPMAAAAAAAADTTGGQEMSPEQIEAAIDLARNAIESLDRIDLALDKDSNDLVVRSHANMVPGSAFDCGPQPAFSEALELTRLLPPGGLITQVTAADYSQFMEMFSTFYASSMQDAMVHFSTEDGDAFDDLWSRYMEMLIAEPMISASTVRMDDGKLSGSTVMKLDGAKELLDGVLGIVDEAVALGMDLGFANLPADEIDGTTVYGWTMDLESMMTASLEAEGADVDAEEMAQARMVMDSLSTTVRLCARDGLLLFVWDDDRDGIAELFRTMDRPAARIDATALALAADAGPACREVFYGDYGVVMNWVLGILPQAQGMTVGPLEFEGWMAFEGPESSSEFTLDLEGLQGLVELIETIEEMEDGHEHGHGHGHAH